MIELLLLASLGVHQEDPVLAELLRQLGDPSIEVREKASRKLVEMGTHAVPHLEKLIAVQDPELRDRVTWILEKIRVRQRIVRLELDKLIPSEVRAKVPNLLERAAGSASEKCNLHDDLRSAVEAGTLRERDLTWLGALLEGPVDAKLRTLIYVDVRDWWYQSDDETVQEAGRKILADMGERFLKDWSRILVRIADSPNDGGVFDFEVANSSRGDDEGVSTAAIAALIEEGGLEVVPVLVSIATDGSADASARKAAIQGVSAMRKKWSTRK